jgi:glycosyltransferase involved in cell wall biosynthesis
MTPTLGIFIPTYGRETLRRCLDSVMPQLLPGDDVLVVGDVRDGPLPVTEAIVAAYGPPVRYLPFTDGQMSWGHAQCDYAQTQLSTDWLFGQDDDDVFTPDAFAAIRDTIVNLDRPRPLLFRFLTHFGLTVWLQRGLVMQGAIGGHCLVQPNIPGKVGYRRATHYEGDFAWIRNTLTNWYPVAPEWVDFVIGRARPA